MMRRFKPLEEGHYAIGQPCAMCGNPFVVGDVTAAVPLDPVYDSDDVKFLVGDAWLDNAALVHWECPL